MAFQSKIADLNRLQEIIRVFTVAGFGDIFKQMGLEPRLNAPAGSWVGSMQMRWRTSNVPSVYAGFLKSSGRPLSSLAKFSRLALTCSDPSGSLNSKNSNRKPPHWTLKSFVPRSKKIWEHPSKKYSRR